MTTFSEWVAGGQRIPLRVPAHDGHATTEYTLFCRVMGQGPWLTLLHGFPTYSRDWEAVAALLSPHYRLLLVDLLGCGDSDKPHRHTYSIAEHADLVDALWLHLGITQTGLISHDIGGTITQELLARQHEGRLATHIAGIAFLNSALYTEHYHPLPITTLLARPVIGPLLAGRLSEASFSKSIAALFSPTHPLASADLHDYWQALQHRQGRQNFSRLFHYLGDKRHHQPRWAGALQSVKIPVRFLWGVADPATGATILPDIQMHHAPEDVVAYPEVGHFPHIEVPEQVAREVGGLFATAASLR